MRLMLATGNAGKLREMRALLAPLAIEVLPQSDLGISPAIEDGLSFIENALIKARHAARHSGCAALADDSGLVVDALGGAPGIFSARYANLENEHDASDFDNNRKLLAELAGMADSERSAHFHCAMAFVGSADDPAPIIAEGRWVGRILEKPAGENGFGYDPLFYVPEFRCTSAELSADEKNAHSHRGQALRAMLERLRAKQLTTLPGKSSIPG